MAGLLADYGVTAVFGVPGGQTLPLYYGILDEGNRIRHILMKDEIDATFAADAYARISGGIGVCDATAGCGAIKFISGLAEAYNTSIPVIAIGSEMEGDWLAARYRGTGSQVVDSKEVLKPVTKWQACLPHVNKMPELALASELFVEGSLNMFAHETNVDIDNRIIVFDLYEMGDQLKPTALNVTMETIQNRVATNRLAGKYTWVFVDEVYVRPEAA